MSKGSKRRPGKPGAYERGYEAIDWAKGRPAPAPPKLTIQDILLAEPSWPIPDTIRALNARRNPKQP